jgi:ribosomal protein L21E
MEPKYIALLFISPLIGLLVVAAVVKYVEVWRARSWKPARGRIVYARPASRKVKTSSTSTDRNEVRNFASIAYEFEVLGKTRRGTRVTIAEDMGNSEVAETLKKYPVGKAVTVYYDPYDADKCVLERDLPPGAFRLITLVIGGFAAFALVMVFGIDWFAEWLRSRLAHPANTPFVVAFSLFALFTLLMARAVRQQSMEAKDWKATSGQITSADFDTFEKLSTVDNVSHRITVNQPQIVYGYEVDGVAYQSNRVAFGAKTQSTSKRLVGGSLKRYRVGDKVTVYYDPENPSEAVLERQAKHMWILYFFAALFAFGAYAFATGLVVK